MDDIPSVPIEYEFKKNSEVEYVFKEEQNDSKDDRNVAQKYDCGNNTCRKLYGPYHRQLWCTLCTLPSKERKKQRTHPKVKQNVHLKKSLFCEICGRSFNYKNTLSNHIKTTHKVSENQCDLCGKIYATERKLKLHKQDLHNKVIKCDNCDKLFGSRTRLKFHVSYSHDKSKPFECTVCFKRFNFKKTVDQHVARVHETNSCSSY